MERLGLAYLQSRQFFIGTKRDIGQALFDAWEDVGVAVIGCLEERVEHFGNIWIARLSGWESHSGIVVSDNKTRATVVFHHLRERVENLIEDGVLLYAGDRVKLPEGDYQIFYLSTGSCRLAIRSEFGDDAPYIFLPQEVSVLVIRESVRKGAFRVQSP